MIISFKYQITKLLRPLLLGLITLAFAPLYSLVTTEAPHHGLLIFLDDSENLEPEADLALAAAPALADTGIKATHEGGEDNSGVTEAKGDSTEPDDGSESVSSGDSSSSAEEPFEYPTISGDLITAIWQEAGPIVASGSLIANITTITPGLPKPSAALLKKYASKAKKSDFTQMEMRILANAIVKKVDFKNNAGKKWIIKQIDPKLYLLLPIKYLRDKRLDPILVRQQLAATAPLSATEQALGLRVNHQPTVTIDQVVRTVSSIDADTPAAEFADYFISALWDTKRQQSNLFVTNQDYFKFNQARASGGQIVIPDWSIYISGHGALEVSLANLTLDQFKLLLDFLEHHLNTRLLYYNSCYAAGLNSDLLYKDATKQITKTYTYAIITQALTESPTDSMGPKLLRKYHMLLNLETQEAYDQWIKLSTQPGSLDYKALAATVTPDLDEVGLGSLPQIKFPGLPWFSVIDEQKVVAIGDVLAKTRTKPLDITSYFTKNGQPANPMGILLYTTDIPFELAINEKITPDNLFPPDIISMVPGAVTHHLKALYSETYPVEELINSLTEIETENKTFIIDEITGLFSASMHAVFPDLPGDQNMLMLKNIIIQQDLGTIYFTCNEAVYIAYYDIIPWQTGDLRKIDAKSDQKADQYEYQHYQSLLSAKHIFTQPVIRAVADASGVAESKADSTTLEAKISHLFAAKDLTASQAQANIITALSLMPEHTLLHIPEISLDSKAYVFELQQGLAAQASCHTPKIIWIDKIRFSSPYYSPYQNFIIDCQQDGSLVFAQWPYPDELGNTLKRSDKINPFPASITDDYLPKYAALRAATVGATEAKSDTASTASATTEVEIIALPTDLIDRTPVAHSLTPANIQKIMAVQQAIIARQRQTPAPPVT